MLSPRFGMGHCDEEHIQGPYSHGNFVAVGSERNRSS